MYMSDVDRSRIAIHDRTQETDLSASDDAIPNRVAVDEIAIRSDSDRLWACVAIDRRAE
jgi:hypothetical protein